MLAGSAANAELRSYFRDYELFLEGDHRDRLRRAMLGARPTVCSFSIDNAVLFRELRHTDLGELLLILRKRKNRSAGADLSTTRAIKIAIG